MSCECGDPDCDPNYDADAFFSFDKTPDRDEPSWSSTDPRPEIRETLIQKIGTVCGAGLVGGCILLCLLIMLAILLTPLIILAIAAWKIVLLTHYLILIPILIVGTWLLIILKFVMSEDPHPRVSRS